MSLIQAVKDFCEGKIDHQALKTAINSTDDINQLERLYDRTALYHACEQGNPEAVKMLIDAGADVNAGSYKPTLAVSNKSVNRLDIMRMLIRAGADINVSNEYCDFDYPPVIWAMVFNDLEMVKLLIDSGCKLPIDYVIPGVAISEYWDPEEPLSEETMNFVGQYLGLQNLYKKMRVYRKLDEEDEEDDEEDDEEGQILHTIIGTENQNY